MDHLTHAKSIFRFLTDLLSIKMRPIQTVDGLIKDGGWSVSLDQKFENAPLAKNFLAISGLGANTNNEGEQLVFSLQRPTPNPFPNPSEILQPWIKGDIYNENSVLSISDNIEFFQEDLDKDAMSGQFRESLSDHPEILQSFDDYLKLWNKWAEEKRKNAFSEKIYLGLFDSRQKINNGQEEWELVLGIGRLKVKNSKNEILDRHLFAHPCTVLASNDGKSLTVVLDSVGEFKVEEDWIIGVKKPERKLLDDFCEQINESEILQLETLKEQVSRLGRSFDPEIETDEDFQPTGISKKSLLASPDLILRKKSKLTVLEMLDSISREIESQNVVPPALLSVIDPSAMENESLNIGQESGAIHEIQGRFYTPLSLNKRQLQVLERATSRRATVVQGPPGTGKTRTIAVLTSHFLSLGKRVLVTAETAQALREVRTQIPEAIRDLAVSSLGGGKHDNDELQRSVHALVEAHHNRSELVENFLINETEITERMKGLSERRALAVRKVLDFRLTECSDVDFQGIKGKPSQLAMTYLDQSAQFNWILEFLDSDKDYPSIDPVKLNEFLEALKNLKSIQPVELDGIFPDPEDLLNLEHLKEFINIEWELDQRAIPKFKLDLEWVNSNLRLIQSASKSLRSLRLIKSNWADEFIEAVLTEEISGTKSRVMELRTAIQHALEHKKLIGNLGEFNVGKTYAAWLPLIDSLNQHIEINGSLILNSKGDVKVSLNLASPVRGAREILKSVRINGKAPTSVEDLQRLRALVEFDISVDLIAELLQDDKFFISSDRRSETIFDLEKLEKQIDLLIIFNNQINEIIQSLQPYKNDLVAESIDLDSLAQIFHDFELQIKFENLNNEIENKIIKLRTIPNSKRPALLNSYLKAVDERDLFKLEELEAKLKVSHKASRLMMDISELTQEFSQGHFKLIEFLNEPFVENKIEEFSFVKFEHKLNEIRKALDWAKLGKFLTELSSGEYTEQFNLINNLDAEIEQSVQELARIRAWKLALERIEPATVSNMVRFSQESKSAGKLSGKTAPRRRREMRKYLEQCIDAIPAWIMPTNRVTSMFRPKIGMFDVVIVDEASQCGLEAIYLFALGKQIVVVGDHKQVSPADKYIEAQVMEEIANRHLEGLSSRANWMNPQRSLFDEARAAFPDVITLVEHRRCVPEIIGFSNLIAYEPDNLRLIPVRQRGSSSLLPIKNIFVPYGYTEGDGSSITNPAEADVIVNEIKSILNSKEYDGMSIGVISLQGNKQHELINQRINIAIDQTDIVARQIRVGKSPDFQGSERNIILLSMVITPESKSTALTKIDYVQRYNVAMSRAKDQVILVHSIRPSDRPNKEDLRRQLLDYCYRVESGELSGINGSVGLVSETQRDNRFDSLFEQRVHNMIVNRGYSVIPQFNPEIEGHDYRIDLVVVGAYGRLAVECDGDYWHGEDAEVKDIERQQQLQQCGWKFIRIIESQFYSDSNRELEKLWIALGELENEV